MDFELTEEQKMFQKLARDFADREIEPIAEEIDRTGKIPSIPSMLKKMAEVGLLSIVAPEEYEGGLGQGFLTYIMAAEQIHYPVTPVTLLMGGQELIELLHHHGTPEQKKKYIPDLINGTNGIPTAAFTEAATGSDPRMITTTAILEHGHWTINGVKRFATWGNSDGMGIFYCKDGKGLSGIIIPKNTEGYTCSKPWGLMGMKGLETVDVFLRDVKVPEANLLGARGKAVEVLMEMIAGGRLLICIRSVATAQRALDEAIKYAKERRTFNGPISDMMGHRWIMAEMACRVEASRYLTYKASYLKEKGQPANVAASMAKLFSGQAGEWVASQSVQIHGAYGYTTDYPIERIYRAAKQSEIAEGSNEVQRTSIGRALVAD